MKARVREEDEKRQQEAAKRWEEQQKERKRKADEAKAEAERAKNPPTQKIDPNNVRPKNDEGENPVRAEDTIDSSHRFLEKPVPLPVQRDIPMDVVMSTVGENITSFSELGKVFYGPFTVPDSYTTPKTYILNVSRLFQSAPGYTNTMLPLDYYGNPFAFFNGSMNVRIIYTDRSGHLSRAVHHIAISTQQVMENQPRLIVLPSAGDFPGSGTTFAGRVYPIVSSLEGVVSIRVPLYNMFTNVRNTSANIASNNFECQDIFVKTTVPANTVCSFFMAYGDDRRYVKNVGLSPFEYRRRNWLTTPNYG